jgi:hypothetical protein
MRSAGGISLREMGYGDLHLPPGWGAVPFDRLFAEIDFPRSPVLNIEIEYDNYRDILPELLTQLREWAALR